VNGGAANAAALRAGVAVELVHNFSLVHDDVMDDDHMRRGRQTVWAQFGVPYAILLGDAMLALASQVLTQGGETGAAAMSAELNSAVVDLCLGQHQDMVFEKTLLVSPDDYLEMAAGKTSSLLAGACVLGAMAGGAAPTQVSTLRRFGHHAGLAFQLVDDVLGIFGDPAVTGKPVGADLLRYKKSMPVLAAMRSGTVAGDELTELYRSRAISESLLGHAVNLVELAGGRDWTQVEAERQHGLVSSCLEEVGGDQQAVMELGALAQLMINRNR
jgi:geranylgeranyl diphosphate synthase type I